MQNFCEFSFPITLKNDISADEYSSFKSKYSAIYNEFKKHPEKISVIADVYFDIELVQTDKIDVDYILNLLRKIANEDGSRTISIETLIKILRKSSDPILVSKRELLEIFITTVLPTLQKDASVDDELSKFIEKQRKKKLDNMSEEYSIPYEELNKIIIRYDYFGEIDNSDIKQLITKEVKEKYKKNHSNLLYIKITNILMNEIKDKIIDIATQYTIYN